MSHAPSSLLDTLERRTDQDPDALQYRYLHKGEVDEGVELCTRKDLLERARALGTMLAEEAAPGDRVLLLYPPGLETFVAFFACLHAGLVAVPMTPPDPYRLAQTLPRLLGIVQQSGAKIVLSTRTVVAAARPILSGIPGLGGLRWIAREDAAARGATSPRRSHDLAFLQYTSGSLGAPKGVMVTQRCLLENLEMIRVGMAMDSATSGVFWLPHHHDMGFIGGGLEFVHCGASCTMMSPVAFIQRPARWLRAISRFGVVVGGGPCFGYDRCARRVTDGELEGLDLGSWRVAFVGAEPVRAATLDRFARRFEPCGFRRTSFYPCYGLAEATLFVSGKPMDDAPAVPRTLALSAEALEQNRVEPRGPEDPGTRTFVSCGPPRLEAEVAIVSPGKKVRARPGEIGEIWTRGPNLALGYWEDEDRTRETFGLFLADTCEGPFLATGDLGFVDGGELYVTGRSKEIMILGGRNHYPQDLEETVEASHPDLRPGGSATFSFDAEDDEVLAIVAEVSQERMVAEKAARPDAPYHDVENAVRAALLKHHGVVPRKIAVLSPGGVLKTTSGKKARMEMRRRFLAGDLERA